MAPAFLLEDIFREEILMRLPVKSLIRCRCVCKLWNSLFFDTYFTRSHLNRSISQNPSHEDDYLILMNTYEGKSPCVLSMLSRTDLSEARIDKVPYPLSSQVDDIYLVGSSNGLVCIAYLNDVDYYFILWNPATHQSRTLLLPRQCTLIYPIPYLFGFGWDSMTEEFKIIANPPFLSLQSIVYSSKTNSWSNCSVNVLSLFRIPVYITKCYCPSVIVKGIPYWNLPQDNSVVIKFDVRTNEFSHFKIPPCVRGYFSLLNMNDCLELVEYGRYISDVYRFKEEGNFWSKTRTINPWKMNEREYLSTYKYGGEIVFIGNNIMYDPKSNGINSLAYSKKSGYSVHGFSYTPSLACLLSKE